MPETELVNSHSLARGTRGTKKWENEHRLRLFHDRLKGDRHAHSVPPITNSEK